jgi:hypothetical protein
MTVRRPRRNHEHKPTRSCPPYNELYEAFRSFFQPIFAERLSEGFRSKTYVNVPSVEADIQSYLDSDIPSVCVLCGQMGIGKSTVLEQFLDLYKDNQFKIPVYLNLQGRRFHFLPTEDFTRLSKEDRTTYAKSAEARRFNELLLPIISDNKILIGTEYFDFLHKNNISELGPAALFAYSEEEKLSILRDFMSDSDKTAPVQCFLRYLCNVRNIQEFTIIVDNVDELPFELVEAIFYVLTDFLECMMRPRRLVFSDSNERNPYGIEAVIDAPIRNTRFRAILACRNHTFEALKRDEGGLYQTRGSDEIALSAGAALGDILQKRLAFFKNVLYEKEDSPLKQDRAYITKSGASVKLSNAFDFLEEFTDKVLKAPMGGPLFDLFNHNYVRAIQIMKYVVQNRYFLLFDRSVLSGG